ncbi:hypothetical protein J7L13_03690, partial [bacterium]|nr:hypothetical protein [bacterium]
MLKKILGCLGVILALLFIGGVALAVVLALAGVNVPVFSPVFYREPPKLPRAVFPQEPAFKPQNLAELQKGQLRLELSEGELSYILQEEIASQQDKIKTLRANIFPDKILIQAVLNLKSPLYLTFEATPSGKDLQVQKVKVGYLTVPLSLVQGFLPNEGRLSLEKIFADEGLQLKEMNLLDQKLI